MMPAAQASVEADSKCLEKSWQYQKAYLMKRPDRVDPAVDSTGFVGLVLKPLLKQGEAGLFRLLFQVVGSFARGVRARQ